MTAKLGPHVILLTPQVGWWVPEAPVVKALDDPGPLRLASRARVLVFRAYFLNQDLDALDPQTAAAVILQRLGDFRDPRLYVELLNEVYQRLGQGFERYVDWTAQATDVLHRAGLKVAGFSFSTGNPAVPSDPGGAAEMLYLRDRGWAGVDAIALHCYWGNQGFTPWHALRYRLLHEAAPDHPPFIITECGRDAVEGGRGGWKLDGLSPQDYAAELLAYDQEIAKDNYVLGATVFTSKSPDSRWDPFTIEDVIGYVMQAPASSTSPGQGPESSTPAPAPSLFDQWVREGGDGTWGGFQRHLKAIGADFSSVSVLLNGWRPGPGLILVADTSAAAMGRPWDQSDMERLKQFGIRALVVGLYEASTGRPAPNPFARATVGAALESGLAVGGYVLNQLEGRGPAEVVGQAKDLLGDLWHRLFVVAVDDEVRGTSESDLAGLLQAVAAAGQRPAVYTAAWFWTKYRKGDFSRYPLWYARYGVEPSLELGVPFGGWTRAVGHQFAGTTALGRYSVDLNIFSEEFVMGAQVDPAVKQEITIQLGTAWGLAEELKGAADVPLGQAAGWAKTHGDAIQAALAVISTRLRELGIIDA